MNDSEFSALLCSRLCHDLISPVGAIANGLEILDDEEDETMRTEVMTLLRQSAEVTSARLKFFRLCFGSAGGFGERVPLGEAENAVRGLYTAGNIALSWQSDVGSLDKGAMKAMLNMVLLAGESLIRGGEISVEIREQPDAVDIEVRVQGARVIFQDSLRKALLGESPQESIEAKTAPAFLAAHIARKLGSRIDYNLRNEQGFSLRMICPRTCPQT